MSNENERDPGNLRKLFPHGGDVADEMRVTLMNLDVAVKVLIESEVDEAVRSLDRDDFVIIIRGGLERMYALGNENGKNQARAESEKVAEG